MKICLLNDSFPPVIDGVANVVLNYAKYLPEDHNVPVIVGTPQYPDADYSGYPYPVAAYPSLDLGQKVGGYRAGIPFSEEAFSALSGFAPDIIHTHCPASSTILARLLREKCGVPIVLTYHTKYEVEIERAVKLPAVAQEGVKLMVENVEACDDVWVVSKGAGESLRSLGYSGDYIVMPNGVDFERGRVLDEKVREVTGGYELPEGVPVFLFVGRIMTYKGIPLILDAMKILADAGQDFRMVFVGKGADQAAMEEKTRDLGISEKCIFVGPVYDRDALRAWNTRADLFLFPSTYDTNGLVVREAAACGLASVLIRDSCASEGITDGRNGFIIEETPDAMAALLLSVSQDLLHLREVGQAAMEEIYLSWSDAVSMAYERYRFVLSERQRQIYAVRRRDMTDYFFTAASTGMSERIRLRALGEQWFGSFRETAEGMMENFRETAEEMKTNLRETAEEKRTEIRERIETIRSDLRKN